MNTTGPVHFLNLEYFFQLFYNSSIPLQAGHTNYGLLFTAIWIIVTGIAYLATLGFLGWLVYSNVRLQQTRELEEHDYSTIKPEVAEGDVEHSRWAHVQALIESPNESDWRQAIIEADIMLDDTLALRGYAGESVGEKLKQADPARFRTLTDAWEAHKIRNEIAHNGSTFRLSGQIAYRTISRYLNVFEEFQVI